MVNSSFYRDLLKDRVINDLRKRSLFGLVFYLIIPFCIFFTDEYYKRHPQATFWSLVIFISIILFRLIYQLYWSYYSSRPEPNAYRALFISVLITAAAWGLISASVLTQKSEGVVRLIMFICTAGFCSGGVIAFIPDKKLSILYNLLIIFPLIILLFDGGRNFGLCTAIALYSIYLILISIRGNYEYWTALENEERFKALHNASFGGIAIHNKGVIIECNRGLSDISGYSVDELIGMNGLFLIAPEFRDQVMKNIISGYEKAYEAKGIRKNGEIFPLRLEARNIPYKGETLRTVEFRDITDQKEYEAEREQLQKKLLHAQKLESIGRLAGGIAHDFNNILTVILGQTELIRTSIHPSSPFYDRLTEIYKAAERSTDLTRHLLAFARKQTIAPKVLDLNEALVGILKMIQRLIGEDIDLAWVPGKHIWPVKIDPSQLDQLLTNLCVNARDAIEGTGRLTIETDNVNYNEAYCKNHPGYLPGDFVVLVVSDNGCGMDNDTLLHIFEPFYTTKDIGKGTGLGLATVYGIVRQNDGFLNVYSEVGEGTTFKIYLPRQQQSVIDPTIKADLTMPEMKGNKTILLVEDELAILEVIQKMLEDLGYTVIPMNAPGEAINVVENHSIKIDLLLTDVIMPEMNGRQLTSRLITRFPQLKTLYMSGYPANVIAHHGVLDPDVAFIEKPFSSKDLAAKLRELLTSV